MVAAAMVIAMMQSAAATVGQERAIVALVVNELSQGDVIVILRDGDIWIGIRDLAAAGLVGFAGRRLMLDGAVRVAAASLAPEITSEFDEVESTLRLMATPSLFARTVMTIEDARPVDLVYSRTDSVFLNYALAWQSAAGLDGFAEVGGSLGPLAFDSGFSRSAATGRIARGLSTMTIDSRTRLQRWTIGDVVVPSGPLDAAFIGGGVTVGREWSLDPYYERYPSPSVSGVVTTPSTVDVYVNGRMVSQEQLPPGPFQITRLPLTSGLGRARVVVRDAFGREQQFGGPYYLTTSLLKRGTHDYQLGFGYARSATATGPVYQRLTAFAREQVGVTGWLTAGVRAQGDRVTQTGTASVNARVWRLGELEVAAATTLRGGRTSVAGRVAYALVTPHLSLSGVVQASDPRYSTIGSPAAGRTVALFAGTISVPLGSRVSASLQHTDDRAPAGTIGDGVVRQQRTTLTTTWRLGGPFELYATASAVRDAGAARRVDAFGGLTILIGRETSLNLTHELADHRSYNAVELQRSVPDGRGIGYDVRATNVDERGASNAVHAALTYQSPFGRYEYVHDVGPGVEGSSATASGGIVAIGGRPHLTRAVSNSYALVTVPGVPNVRVYSNNQEIGRTGRSGALLVPNLLPYQANRLAVADVDLPLDYDIETTTRTVAPPFRGGALASFPAVRIQTVSGRIVVNREGLWLAPSFREMVVVAGNRRLASPIGDDGEFYFENLPIGSHTATVALDIGECAVVLTIASNKAFTELGTLRCELVTGQER
jgi:outer membrane usher protein